ncbi:MAG: tRNA (5-methylaminomethyl-2-thiouridine)(34)-methyltransferase MnmD [Neomegalonema sp.]|nr:tRNA (5-methylaminomethyl-2-thiouridine)(34)-methyltransferase MnmD [Neomegalonema sp.]
MTDPDTPNAPNPPQIDWTEAGSPRALAFDDVYYSDLDGRAETDHVYLGGNGLPERWQGAARFCIGELGFGVGLNFCQTWARWREVAEPGAVLDYVSFEIAPPAPEVIAKALSRWPELAEPMAALLAAWPAPVPAAGWHRFDWPGIRLHLAIGDARAMIGEWGAQLGDLRAEAWFLDGFNPAKNPQLWEVPLLSGVAAHSAPGASAASYTAAGWVRRNLAEAGFTVSKARGFAHKRDMLVARLG